MSDTDPSADTSPTERAPSSGSSPVELPESVIERLASLHAEGLLDEASLSTLIEAHSDKAQEIRRLAASIGRVDGAFGEALTPIPGNSLSAGTTLGPFELIEPLGRGGMGAVWRARQRTPVARDVALKVIKQGMDTAAVLQRFERERRSLARMDHDAIAKIYEAGATPTGQPWFAMELVTDALPLGRYCDEHALDISARLELFCRVCDGVQHAHQKGVIHRDLKPGNILIGRGERPSGNRSSTSTVGMSSSSTGGGTKPPVVGARVKIIDFGLALGIEGADGASRLSTGVADRRTRAGDLLGTPEYMSPEQAGAIAADVDARTDVYALGVVLFELLTGRLPSPHDEARVAGSTAVGVLQQKLRDSDPPLPSRAVEDRARARALRGDLDWVVARALEREPERRYATVNDLAGDVRRYLDDEPVEAGPGSRSYRLRKIWRRNRTLVSAATAVFAALLAAVTVVSLALSREARARSRLDVRNKDFEQLKAVVLLERARTAYEALGPGVPTSIPPLEAWLEGRIVPLRSMMAGIEQTVAILTERSTEGLEVQAFDAAADEFLASTLQTVLEEFATLEDWPIRDIESRLARARCTDTIDDASAWDRLEQEVVAARQSGVLHPSYPDDFVPTRQPGLWPLGIHPRTGLLEFADLGTAWDPTGAHGSARPPTAGGLPTAADRDERGEIPAERFDGVVFVLLAGGTTTMGMQSTDPAAPRYVADLQRLEEGPYSESFSAFLLAKHELTQAQWLRVAASNPSSLAPGTTATDGGDLGITLHHPVETLSYDDVLRVARGFAWSLPTEAQWNHACLAGREPPLRPVRENFLDRVTAQQRSPQDVPAVGDYEDPFRVHAPAGSFAANPFGFFDMLGNVEELVLDLGGFYPASGQARSEMQNKLVVVRGSSFDSVPARATGYERSVMLRNSKFVQLGCRVARPWRP